MKLNENETKVLHALDGVWDYYGGGGYTGFDGIADETKLDRKVIRRACRSLARKGLAEYARGLWTEDGEPGGSGYGLTKAGKQHANAVTQDK